MSLAVAPELHRAAMAAGMWSVAYLSIPFRYRSERPVCLMPVCRLAQKELRPISTNIPADSGHLGRAIPGEIGSFIDAGTVVDKEDARLDCSSLRCRPR
jgi:hypothetical protein